MNFADVTDSSCMYPSLRPIPPSTTIRLVFYIILYKITFQGNFDHAQVEVNVHFEQMAKLFCKCPKLGYNSLQTDQSEQAYIAFGIVEQKFR